MSSFNNPLAGGPNSSSVQSAGVAGVNKGQLQVQKSPCQLKQ
jgi:hypothetical protein